MKDITFRVGDRILTFTEEQLQNIIEGQYTNTLKGGKCFRVTPEKIDRAIFEEKTNSKNIEWYRELILEAFHEWDMNPDKYLRAFDIYTGEPTLFARKYHNADWVEIALAWAQFIANGASWHQLHNLYYDHENIYFSSVIWKDGNPEYLGFSYAYHRYFVNTDDRSPRNNKYRYAIPVYVR